MAENIALVQDFEIGLAKSIRASVDFNAHIAVCAKNTTKISFELYNSTFIDNSDSAAMYARCDSRKRTARNAKSNALGRAGGMEG